MDSRLQAIADALSSMPEVQAAAQSGHGFPMSGDGDVDVFVYSESIPSITAREAAYASLKRMTACIKVGRFDSPAWGVGDFLRIDEVEIWLMWYATVAAEQEVDAFLSGKHLDKLYGQLYPTGRLSSILHLEPLFARSDFLSRLQDKVRVYPPTLAASMVAYHTQCLTDAEAFERAVSRGEVLLFHQSLEDGLDHFLQALFALNRVYFPSRKRTLRLMKDFALQPKDCGERLLQTVRHASEEGTLVLAFDEWRALCGELDALYQAHPIVG